MRLTVKLFEQIRDFPCVLCGSSVVTGEPVLVVRKGDEMRKEVCFDCGSSVATRMNAASRAAHIGEQIYDEGG